MRAMWRYEIPVDDAPHKFTLSDFPLNFGLRKNGSFDWSVEFWAMHNDDPKSPTFDVEYLVVGTGHKLPDNSFAVDTVPRDLETNLVFHVVELLGE